MGCKYSNKLNIMKRGYHGNDNKWELIKSAKIMFLTSWGFAFKFETDAVGVPVAARDL